MVSVISEPRMTPETHLVPGTMEMETVSPGRQDSGDSDSGVNMPVAEREVTINNTPGKY